MQHVKDTLTGKKSLYAWKLRVMDWHIWKVCE